MKRRCIVWKKENCLRYWMRDESMTEVPKYRYIWALDSEHEDAYLKPYEMLMYKKIKNDIKDGYTVRVTFEHYGEEKVLIITPNTEQGGPFFFWRDIEDCPRFQFAANTGVILDCITGDTFGVKDISSCKEKEV